MNRLLFQELGQRPVHSWVYSESAEFLHPAQVFFEDGSPEFEYVCQCGINVVIHGPRCASMVVARQKVALRKIDPKANCQYVACTLQYVSLAEWISVFGTHVAYPQTGKWMPLASNMTNGPIRLNRDLVPNEDVSWHLIQMVREHRSRTIAQLDNETDDALTKKEKNQHDDLQDEIKEDFGASFFPGHKEEKSFPDVAVQSKWRVS